MRCAGKDVTQCHFFLLYNGIVEIKPVGRSGGLLNFTGTEERLQKTAGQTADAGKDRERHPGETGGGNQWKILF